MTSADEDFKGKNAVYASDVDSQPELLFGLAVCARTLGYVLVAKAIVLRVAPMWWQMQHHRHPLELGTPHDFVQQLEMCMILAIGAGLLYYPRNIGLKRAALGYFSIHWISVVLWLMFGEDTGNNRVWALHTLAACFLSGLALHSNFEEGDRPWRVNPSAWKTYEGFKSGWSNLLLGGVLLISGALLFVQPAFYVRLNTNMDVIPWIDPSHFSLLNVSAALIGLGLGGISNAASKGVSRMYLMFLSLLLILPFPDALAGRYSNLHRSFVVLNFVFLVLFQAVTWIANRDFVELPTSLEKEEQYYYIAYADPA